MPELKVLDLSRSDMWLDAVSRSFQHDFYHLPAYHALAEYNGEGAARLFLFTEGEYTVALPLLLQNIGQTRCHTGLGQELRDAHCVYGYAGPVASHPDIPQTVQRNFRVHLMQTLRQMAVVSVFTRLHPLIPMQNLLSGLGECLPMGQTVSIDLTLPVEAQRAQFRKDYKRRINKLIRLGGTCLHDRQHQYLPEFVDIYGETMQRVGARGDYFFNRAYFEQLLAGLGPHAHLFVCLLEQNVIAGGLFTLCDGLVQAHLAGSRSQFAELSPNKLLFDHVRLWANEQGARVFHLGGGLGSRDDSLFYFKAGFSRQRHDFSIWRWVLSPALYEQLSQEKKQWCRQHCPEEMIFPDYFPAYRCPGCPLCPDGVPNSRAHASLQPAERSEAR